MSMIAPLAAHGALASALAARTAATSSRPERGAVSWIRRYLPAEVAGTATMTIVGLAVASWTTSPVAIAAGGLLGATLGFAVVLAVTVRFDRHLPSLRILPLLVGGFGRAELVDLLFARPICLLLGVALLGDPLGGLLVGKIVADVAYCAVAASRRHPHRAGWRGSTTEAVEGATSRRRLGPAIEALP